MSTNYLLFMQEIKRLDYSIKWKLVGKMLSLLKHEWSKMKPGKLVFDGIFKVLCIYVLDKYDILVFWKWK